MRCYELTVGDLLLPKLRISLNEWQPVAPRISFNIQIVSRGVFIPSQITVYNLPISYFSAAASLVDSPIMLRAGIVADPITRFCGIEASGLKTIFSGSVWSVVPDYDGTNCHLTFYCGVGNASNVKTASKAILSQAVAKNQSITQGYMIFMRKLLGPKYLVTATPAALGNVKYMNTTPTTVQINHPDLQSAIAALENWGLGCLIRDNTIEIYAIDIDDKIPRGFKCPSMSNFTSQPAWTSISELSATLLLDGDWAPMMQLMIPPFMATSAASLVGDANFLAAASPSNYDPTSIVGGSFTVISVWHSGDSSNSSADSWITTLTTVADKALV